MDLGKGVRALKSGSVLSPFSVITLITSDLAVTAMQTSHFQAALEGQAGPGGKGGRSSLTAPSQLPNHIKNFSGHCFQPH